MSPEKWSRKATEAAHIFQEVLDTEQDGITLAEIRHTIHALMEDFHEMTVGSITRIKNYLKLRVKKDETRARGGRNKYMRELKQMNSSVNLYSTDQERQMFENISKTRYLKNPSMGYGMVDRRHWRKFMGILSEGYISNCDNEEDAMEAAAASEGTSYTTVHTLTIFAFLF